MISYFTSESVSAGHPDKIADQISDLVLDHLISQDPKSRVACEVAVFQNRVVVFGEYKSRGNLNGIEDAIRALINKIGYNQDSDLFHYAKVDIDIALAQQSDDISIGVDKSTEGIGDSDEINALGAGDQGIMFGYATSETDNLMPLEIAIANDLMEQHRKVLETIGKGILRPDAKAQVTLKYGSDSNYKSVDTVLISTQHVENIEMEDLFNLVSEHIVRPVIEGKYGLHYLHLYVNPTGRFVIGGAEGDAGLTGRKIVVDTYGGRAPHGGGAFSGKDGSKVDRSGAYMARLMARTVVKAGIARECLVQLSYGIGLVKPLSIQAFTDGKPNDWVSSSLEEYFDCRPQAIINQLHLETPLFSKTTIGGHFGKEGLPWESDEHVESFLKVYNPLGI